MTKNEKPVSLACPVCGALVAVTGRPHCTSPTCSWLRCECHTIFDRDRGLHYNVRRTK